MSDVVNFEGSLVYDSYVAYQKEKTSQSITSGTYICIKYIHYQKRLDKGVLEVGLI